MTQREEFVSEFKRFSGLDVLFDEYDSAYVTKDINNAICNSVASSAWWGWKAAKAQAAPEGWKLVPVEPSKDAIYAGVATWHTTDDLLDKVVEAVYKSMLAAAPEIHK